MSYKTLLRNPKWIAKRDAILERDDYTCRRCGTDKCSSWNVHHLYYLPSKTGGRRKPWDYPDEALVTLCWSCHEEEEADIAALRKLVNGCDGSLQATLDFARNWKAANPGETCYQVKPRF